MTEKCEELAKQIREKNVNAKTTVESYITGCLVDFWDQKLDETLEEAVKLAGGWTTRGSVAIDQKGRIPESDIPLNMQICELHPFPPREGHTEKMQSIKALPEACKLYGIHIHNGQEHQSVHFKVSCQKSDQKEIDSIAGLIFETQVLGRAICEGRKKKDIIKELKSKKI